MRRQLVTGLLMTIVMTVLLGLLYPLAMTGAGQVFARGKANGSFVSQNGKVVGSSLIGQSFTDRHGNPIPRYFQSRPSAAGDGYDARASGGTNWGPSAPQLITAVKARVLAYRKLNGLGPRVSVPVDAVTASASGLDPAISVANARLQAPRVAEARHVAIADVLRIVAEHTQNRQWGILGEKAVNVLDVNLALDQLR